MSTNKAKPWNNSPSTVTRNNDSGVSSRKSCESPSIPKAEAVKKTPPIKAPVGVARGPDLKNVRSKIGSLDNVKYRPAGGEKKVESQKLTWNASSRIGSLDNAKHRPLGGEVKVMTQKLEWKAQSKVGSLDNVKHSPGGGQVKIFDEKYAPSPALTPTPQKSGASTPNHPASTPKSGAKENGDTLKTLTGARMSAEKLEKNRDSNGSSSGAENSVNSTPNNSATSQRTVH